MKNDWFEIALESHKKSNYSQALFAIEKYVEANPANKRGKLLQAIVYGDLCNYKQTLLILSQIKPTESDEKGYSSLYYSELGSTNEAMGDYEEAIKWYEKVIELKPEQTDGYILKGACLASAGEYELAKAAHLKATKLKGHPEEAYYNLALIYRAEMNFEQAKEYCKKSLKIDPTDTGVKHCYEDIKKNNKIKE